MKGEIVLIFYPFGAPSETVVANQKQPCDYSVARPRLEPQDRDTVGCATHAGSSAHLYGTACHPTSLPSVPNSIHASIDSIKWLLGSDRCVSFDNHIEPRQTFERGELSPELASTQHSLIECLPMTIAAPP